MYSKHKILWTEGTVTSTAEVQINGTCVPSRCEDYYNSLYHSNCPNSTLRQLHLAAYYMTVHTRARALISPSLHLNIRIFTYTPECNYFMWHSKDTGRHSLITTRSHCEPRVTEDIFPYRSNSALGNTATGCMVHLGILHFPGNFRGNPFSH